MLVTIDPGANTGWALWSQHLVAAGLGDPRSCPLHRGVKDVWIESPVIYPRSKARPNDILKLARDAGHWSGVYDALGAQTHFVSPAAWKGQLSKDVCHARAWSALSEKEQAVVTAAVKGVAPSKRHNVLDAVALGVWVRRGT